MQNEFPGLQFHAVTHRHGQWPSLRFELAGGFPEEEPVRRIAQSTETAVTIFEAAFSSEDAGFFSYTTWPWKKDEWPLLLSLLPTGCSPDRTEGQDFWGEGEDDKYVTYTAALQPRSVDYRSLFRLIAANELGEWELNGSAYFINVAVPRIFYMYDDCGAMLLASRDKDLCDFRTGFGDWIIP